jgi:hypothetical protein
MSGTLAGVTSLGSEVVLYVKIEWLPNGAQNVRFLAGFSLTHRQGNSSEPSFWEGSAFRALLETASSQIGGLRLIPSESLGSVWLTASLERLWLTDPLELRHPGNYNCNPPKRRVQRTLSVRGSNLSVGSRMYALCGARETSTPSQSDGISRYYPGIHIFTYFKCNSQDKITPTAVQGPPQESQSDEDR